MGKLGGLDAHATFLASRFAYDTATGAYAAMGLIRSIIANEPPRVPLPRSLLEHLRAQK